MDNIRKHPFFYGVDWNSIRNIEAPFIPRLKSITDTSYFPTDELDQVPDEPAGGDATGAHKELAFLGSVDLLHFRIPGTDVLGGAFPSIQLHLQKVHAFFARFLISRHRQDTIPVVWGHEETPRIHPSIFPFKRCVA